tara:strand:- start:48 stop:305 length:258 start_codon:yes stop_codon:yes gene_type:complete
MNEDIELLKKKIIYKSSYRGIKELDIILSLFVRKNIDKFNTEELYDLFELLNNNDDDIYKFKQGLSKNDKIKKNNVSDLFKKFNL